MSGFGSTPVSTTPLGVNQFPLSAVYVPDGDGNLKALQGDPGTTDTLGNYSSPVVVVFGGTATHPLPANSGVVAIKASPGRLATVIVTTTGPAQLNLYDNASIASGTIIGAIPGDAAVGSVYQFYSPAILGIVANSVASCCSVTICFY